MKDNMCGLVKEENGPSGLVYHTDLPVPQIDDDEVLIKVHCTAICGTDLHIIEWDDWSQKRIKAPVTLGHETAGEIVVVGKNVTERKEREAVRLHPERRLRRVCQDPLGLHLPAGG